MFLDHERPRARNKYPRVEFIIVRITLSRNEINVFIRGVTDFRRFPTFTVLPIFSSFTLHVLVTFAFVYKFQGIL